MLPVFLTASFAAVICTYNHAVAQGILSKAFPLLTIPQVFLNLPSFAISLLLVFRTNTSY